MTATNSLLFSMVWVYRWKIRMNGLVDSWERRLGLYWRRYTETDKAIPTPATFSEDDGRTWLPVYDTGISGQMGCTIGVGGKRVAAIYNRRDDQRPGVWAVVSEDGEYQGTLSRHDVVETFANGNPHPTPR